MTEGSGIRDALNSGPRPSGSRCRETCLPLSIWAQLVDLASTASRPAGVACALSRSRAVSAKPHERDPVALATMSIDPLGCLGSSRLALSPHRAAVASTRQIRPKISALKPRTRALRAAPHLEVAARTRRDTATSSGREAAFELEHGGAIASSPEGAMSAGDDPPHPVSRLRCSEYGGPWTSSTMRIRSGLARRSPSYRWKAPRSHSPRRARPNRRRAPHVAASVVIHPPVPVRAAP